MESMVEHRKENTVNNKELHRLYDNWTLWAHLPHDTDWSLSSYYKIITLETIEDALLLFETFPEVMVTNCMLFLMRAGINPTWEDANNRNGGSFSYKINNRTVPYCWKNLSYVLLGETLTPPNKSKFITGITISPKKNFCIIKIWLSNCDNNDPDIITNIDGLPKHGCLFKKHIID
tara:strand:- start:415 stop:942 length:528 start_codon:yes stop_codon:yes gene_type:complete